MIAFDRIKVGMSLMVSFRDEYRVGTVITTDPKAQEVGVRLEGSGERCLVKVDRLSLSFRKNGEGVPQPQQPNSSRKNSVSVPRPQYTPPNNNEKVEMLEGYLVALSEGKISDAGLQEIAEAIKKGKKPVKEVRTQELVKYY